MRVELLNTINKFAYQVGITMKKKPHRKPFIYYEYLKAWEKVCIVFYGIATLFVIIVSLFGNAQLKQNTMFFYAAIFQIAIYFFLYTSLRNFKSFLIWFGFGIIHLILFLIFKGDSKLQMKRGNASNELINSIPLLLLFQLMRYISLKIQHREFVMPSKGGGTDLFENKNPSPTDYLILIIYMGSFTGLNILMASI